MSVIALSEMAVGQKGIVQDLLGDPEICQRLLEMGLTSGTVVEIVRFAPMGDPIDIKVRGYHLSLRRHEAESIKVDVK